MTCELCYREATHVDGAVVDLERSGIHGPTVYRDQPLCHGHAMERRSSSTSRVRCLHIRLDTDGYCYRCGADCRQ